MHAAGVEAVPAVALGAAAVALAVELGVLVDDVVLAGDVMHVELGLRDDLVGIVELGRLREVRNVAGVQHERRPRRYRLDPADRLLERALGVGVGGLVKAHVAVADLQEREPLALLGLRLAEKAERARHAARHGPQQAGAGPGHAFENLAPARSVIV